MFLVFRVGVISLLGVITLVYGNAKLPDSMPLCRKSDPKLNDCLKEAIEKSVPILVAGLPQFDLPSFDPLLIHELFLNGNNSKVVHVNLRMSQCELYGLSKMDLISVEADWDNYLLKINVKVNNIQIVGNYEINGKLSVLPINGTGTFNITFEGGNGHIELIGKGVEKNGMKYMSIEDLSYNYEADHMSIMFNNLFNGDKGRGDNINALLNERWQVVMQELNGTVTTSFSSSFKDYARKIFDNVPLDFIAIP